MNTTTEKENMEKHMATTLQLQTPSFSTLLEAALTSGDSWEKW